MIFRWSSHKKSLQIEFFEYLSKKVSKLIAKYNKQGMPAPPEDYYVRVWVSISLDLLRGDAWYEEDGRHARKVRNYWKNYEKQGGTAPKELTKKEMAFAKIGRDLFLSGEYKNLD